MLMFSFFADTSPAYGPTVTFMDKAKTLDGSAETSKGYRKRQNTTYNVCILKNIGMRT